MMSRKRRANRGHLIFVFCIELATRQSIIAYVLSCLMQAEADAISESSSLAPFCHNAMLDFATLAGTRLRSGVQDTLCDCEILRRLPMFCLFVAAGRAAGAGHDERSQAVVVTQHGGTQL